LQQNIRYILLSFLPGCRRRFCVSFGQFFFILFCTKHLQQISDYFVFKEDDDALPGSGKKKIWKIFHAYLHKKLASKHQISFLFKRR